MSTTSSNITISNIKELLVKHYGISGELRPLVGYEDLNYLVKTKRNQHYVLKISPSDFDNNYLEYQITLHHHLNKQSKNLKTPKIINTLNSKSSIIIEDKLGKKRILRVLSFIEGRLWSKVNPITESLRFQLGKQAALITDSLSTYNHAYAHRTLEWDIANSLWTKNHLDLFNKTEQELLIYFISLFEENNNDYKTLRKSVVHNDVNDNNIIVSNDLLDPKVEAIIDFGDAIYTQCINDLAITCAYAIMNCNDPLSASIPLVKAYNESFKLEDEELKHLYYLIGMRLVVSVTKSAIEKTINPDNEYLQISVKTAWDLLYKWRDTSKSFAYYAFRYACNFTPHPNEIKFKKWINQTYNLQDLIPLSPSNEVLNLDLSVGSTWTGHEKDMENLDLFQFRLDQLQKKHPTKILAGGYCEARGIYKSDAYDKIGNHGKESRTIHMGIDFWFKAGTAIHALFDGVVVTAVNDKGDKEYGGLLILKHHTDEFEFYTLYGHNTVESVLKHSVGDRVNKGDKISELGNYPENGNWAPHLHFQIMLSMLDYKDDFPGVVYHDQLDIWKSILPDPNLLFQNNNLTTKTSFNNTALIEYRKQHLGKGLSLQYKTPLNIVRGSMQYLIDITGRKYLDTVNNVAHVGHENYNVVQAGRDQMAVLNTNTRYLHDSINALTKVLLKTLPKELSVVHYVNSGSEANELALRMVKTCTSSQQIIASQIGYHGNTNLTVDVSSYKFDGKGGSGAPETTHVFPIPDTFRGKYTSADAAMNYAEEIESIIKEIKSNNKKVGGLIIEPILSCGGQIELPKGFLKTAYKLIREAGGLCISDEVQTGCGRMGQTFWGFQLHGVVPDIVTIGKPFGNGHPVAAVVCTKEVAEGFANGMEYFNTFGGNPVSCAIAKEVLLEVKRQNLQAHALEIGNYLKSELIRLSKQYPIIGDVRGQGLFLGIELVDNKLQPLPSHAHYLIARMKAHGILMSIDGPDNNVIKIKPPMVFNKTNADELIYFLKKVLEEDFMLYFQNITNKSYN